MANRENGRGRLLCLLEILQKETDAEHGLSTQELITKLDEAGFPANRKTLYDDIHALEDSSIPVEKSGGKVPKYYIEDRDFEVEEIVILIDAIESAGFMTEKKKASLIKKLKGLTSSPIASELNEQIQYIGRHHSSNNDFIYTVNTIRRAISEKHPVTFKYIEYTFDPNEKIGKESFRHDGMLYILHPLALVWENGFYYCLGIRPEQSKSDKTEEIYHFRIDRMKEVKAKTDTKLAKTPKGFSVAKHAQTTFGMYGDDPQQVTLRFRKNLLTQFYDRFERELPIFSDPKDKDYLQANVSVSVSPTFFSWVSQYEGGFSIIGPKSVKEKYEEHIRNALDVQN